MVVGSTSDDDLRDISAEGGRRGQIYRALVALRDMYGEVIREKYPDIPRRASGYNLDELLPERGFNVARALVGTESTCALVLEATVRLVPSPRHRTLAVVAYHDQFAAADDVLAILEHGPIGLEAVDETVTRNMLEAVLLADDVALYPPGGAWLLAEFGADSESEAIDRARGLEAALTKRNGGASTVEIVSDGEGQRRIWAVREAAIGASRIPGKLETWPSFEDAAVPPER